MLLTTHTKKQQIRQGSRETAKQARLDRQYGGLRRT